MTVIRTLGLTILMLARAASAWGSLAETLSNLAAQPLAFDVDGEIVVVGQAAPDYVGAIAESLAIRGIDFPPVSTTPGATFRYNSQLGIFERATDNLGPVFVERAETIGEHQFDLGFSVLYGDLDSIDGGDFGPTLFETGTVVDIEGIGETELFGVYDVSKFSLESFQMSFSGTFGITERWDVNLLLPLVYNRLEATARQGVDGVVRRGPNRGALVLSSRGPQMSVSDEAFGVGDIQLRTKFRFVDDPLPFAGGLTLRLPSGDEDNFMGTGDVTLTPFVVVSRVVQRFDFHGSLGIEANASDVDKSRGLYALGVTTQIFEPLAFLLDFVGSSTFGDVDVDVPGTERALAPNGVGQEVSSGAVFIPRSDYLNIVSGFKFALPGRVVGFLGAIVPVNDSGLRADVLPTGGIEVTF